MIFGDLRIRTGGGAMAVALGALLLGSAAGRAETVSLVPVRDNTLFESASGSLSSGSGPAVFAGANSGLNARRALLAFDVSTALPEDAVIEQVELHLIVSNVPNDNPTTLGIHAVSSDWGEGASSSNGGGGAPAESLDATWLHKFHPDELWSQAGGDFDAPVLASAVVAGTGEFVWSSEALAADVARWRTDPASNFGWIIVGDEETASSARRIDSREAPDPATRPWLVIQYRKDPVAIDPASWSEVKSTYR